MKRMFVFLAALCVQICSLATMVVKAPAPIASRVYLPVGINGARVSLADLSRMKVSELEALTGQKMRLVDKIGFRIAQRDLRKSIRADGTFDNRKPEIFAGLARPTSDFHIGGFALGFWLGPLGVLIAYLIQSGRRDHRVKWAWIGFGISILLLLAFWVYIIASLPIE